MLGWISIVIIAGIFLYIFVRVDHGEKKIKLVILFIIFLLLYISFIGFKSSNKIDIDSTTAVGNTAFNYVKWVGHTVSNIWSARDDLANIVGNAAKTPS